MTTRGRIPIILLLPLLLLLAGGASAYFFLFRPKSPPPPPPEETYLLQLAEFVVNLADQNRPHYLSASVGLIIAGPHAEDIVEERKAQIRDAVIMAMTQHTHADLLSAEGKLSLKEDIRAAVEQALAQQDETSPGEDGKAEPDPSAGQPFSVREVLFTDFVME